VLSKEQHVDTNTVSLWIDSQLVQVNATSLNYTELLKCTSRRAVDPLFGLGFFCSNDVSTVDLEQLSNLE